MEARKSFTITWRIKNFSFCWQKDEMELSGPTFAIEGLHGSKWTLFLFPRASRSKKEGNIACYLQHECVKNGSQEIKIDYELSILGCDGLPLETASFTKCTMQGNDWSAPLLLKKKTVFLEKRDRFLPKDTLTIRCRMWNVNQESIIAQRYFATTRIEVEKLSIFRVVNKISTHHGNEYYLGFVSPSSDSPLVHMNVKVAEDGSQFIEIKKAESELLKFCKCKLNFKDDRGREIAYGEDEFLFNFHRIPLYCDASVWIFPLTYREQENAPYQYIWNQNPYGAMGNLILHCEITYSTGIVTENIEKVNYSINTFRNGCCLKEKRHEYLPTLKDDLLSLMTNPDHCDVKLQTGTKTFLANKIILSARSIFFRNEFKEKKSRKIIYVYDLDNDTLNQMLVFLYTDTIENIESKNAMDLYIASERYGIPSLKHRCSCFLQNNIDASICCDVLQVADQYQDSDLKKAALNYILDHPDEIIGSDTWQDMERFTELTEEILCLKRLKEFGNI